MRKYGPWDTRGATEDEFKKETFRFYTDGILNKCAYGDGNILNQILYDWDVYFGPTDHESLYKVVSELVVSKITSHKNIELHLIQTSHNPVRAYSVDGVEVYYSNPDGAIKFEPEYVEITGQELIDCLSNPE